jgi:ATP-binding cassette subfamily B protein RaxB
MNTNADATWVGTHLNFGGQPKLPLVRQAEAAECGLACLAMVAAFHGFVTDLQALRRRFPLGGQGTNLKMLIDIAARLELGGRALKADLGDLDQLQLPCILHWGMNHFVVLKSLHRKRAVIHDPALGIRSIKASELAQHYTGVALELTPTQSFAAAKQVQQMPLTALWSRITGLKRSLIQILFLSLLLQLFAVVAPFYVQTVVDDVILRGDTGLLTVLAAGFGLLLLVEVGTSALRSSFILHLASRLHLQLATNLLKHLLRLPMDYFQRRHLGDVLSRFSSIDAVKDILTTGLVSALVDGLMALVTLIAMFIYDGRLTAIVLAVLAIYVAIRITLYAPLRRLTEESIAAAATTETSLIESIRAIQTIKLFQRESERQAHWQNRLAEAMNKDIRIARLGIGFEVANKLLFGIENILVVYFAALAVMGNVFSVGMFFAFISYKQRFIGAMDGLVTQLIEIKMLGVHLQRIADIAYTPTERQYDPAPPTAKLQGRIEARGISCQYSEFTPPVFSKLDFEIRRGETVAIVGPSGCGKSSLLKILMGLVPATEGEIRIDNLPLANLPHYREHIAGVLQDDQLLSGSIADNIACHDHLLDLEKVARCADMACIHEDILNMPMQYNTPVGDMGSTLSGGQVQRIMLARAFYREPAILFLDEATSHLDIDMEKMINAHIATLNITRVLVAHRPETIRMADRVIELRQDCRDTNSRNGA